MSVPNEEKEILDGMNEGKTIIIDRRDSSALPICLKLEKDGFCKQEFIEYDEQSSAIKFRKI